jgi:hypothetical protein
MASLNSPYVPHFSDPRRFLRASLASANIAANSADYFTGQPYSLDRLGVDDNTNYTATTAKTILNVTSGSGYLAGVIGPTQTNVGDTTTFTITVDGAAYSITVTQQVASSRAVLGHIAPPAIFTTADRVYSSAAGVSTENTTLYIGTPNYRSPIDVPTALLFGTGIVFFGVSLKIEITSSINQTGTANQERRSGALYQRIS